MRSLFIVALAALASGASAQTSSSSSLSGRVLDPSGAPVPQAKVTVTSSDTAGRWTALTDAAGRYTLPSLRTGTWLVEATADGFGSAQPFRVNISGEGSSADLRLEIANVATRVQVTAAALAQSVDEQSKALTIVDSAQLERRAEYSVADALRVTPGLRVQQLGGPGSFTRVIMRGMRSADTSILVDGFRLRDAASPQGDATAIIGDLLLTATDRIEVLRGSGSSLYGTHATSGVVNVISDTGGGPLRGDLSVEGGGLGLVRSTARMSGSAWRDRLRWTGGATHLNVTKGIDRNDRARNTSGHGFAQLQLGEHTSLSGRLLVADTFVQLNDTPYLQAGRLIVSPDDPDNRRAGMSTIGTLTLAHTWNARASTRFSYSGVSTARDTRDGPGGTRFEPQFNDSNQFDGRIDTMQARSDFQLDRRHTLVAGYEFEREAFDNISRNEDPDQASRIDARLRISQRSHAMFAQAQGRYLQDRLQVLVSGRLQHFDLSHPLFSDNNPLYRSASLPSPSAARTGDISVSYHVVSTGTRLRAHVGNGYRAPALFERFGASFFFGSFSAYGDPGLRPERLLAADAGFDQYFFSSRVRVSGTYFYTRIQEAIIFDFSNIVPATDPWGRFGGYSNTRGGLARGLEWSIEAMPYRSLTLQSSYTWTNADDRVSQLADGSLRAVRVSDHMFTAAATQRIGRRLDLTFDLAAASDYVVPFTRQPVRFEGPVRGDIVLSWTQPLSDNRSVRFYTRVENVFNREYLEEGFRTPKAWAVAGIKWFF